ncbi:Hypothetical protein NGAL_HAMBI2610_31640 [Neorhizobium galegae bv. orientalis]|nr:Hypothetical protein NGAL_HAMBI2610_31640 [Neorhizobium galegae bv. orientalis]
MIATGEGRRHPAFASYRPAGLSRALKFHETVIATFFPGPYVREAFRRARSGDIDGE